MMNTVRPQTLAKCPKSGRLKAHRAALSVNSQARDDWWLQYSGHIPRQKKTEGKPCRKSVKETPGEGFLLQTRANRKVIWMETGRYQWGGKMSGLAARPGIRSPRPFGRTMSNFRDGAAQIWRSWWEAEQGGPESNQTKKLGDLLLWVQKSRSKWKSEAEQEGAEKDWGPVAWKNRW